MHFNIDEKYTQRNKANHANSYMDIKRKHLNCRQEAAYRFFFEQLIITQDRIVKHEQAY